MSHEVETMAYANAVPWHGLGARVDGNISTEEMLIAAGLNWRVEKQPLKIVIDDQIVPVPGRYALVRDTDKKVMTITGNEWHPMQNAETLGFMRDYVEAGGASLETAGSLHGGKVIWALARLNHSFQVTPGDKVNGYLLLTTSHEVGRANIVRTTTVRVVCANTMAIAERHGKKNYRQDHRSIFNVEAAKEAVGKAHEDLLAAENRAKTLSALKLSLEDAVKLVIVPSLGLDISELSDQQIMDPGIQTKSLRQIIESINSAPGAVAGNGWGVLNGVTHYADHVAGNKAESRMFRAWVGDLGDLKMDVERRLLELV
jgi:phage/plasmid-like protein (TIGR03299 family)